MENIVSQLGCDLDLIVGKLEDLNQSMLAQRLPDQPNGTRETAKRRVITAESKINRLLAKLRYSTISAHRA